MASLSSEGLKSSFQQLDINDVDSISTAAAFFKEKYGGVDVLINNAAIAFKGGSGAAAPERWRPEAAVLR